jgi:putative transposase
VAKHRKVYRFRMEPTAAQEQAMGRNAGARRFIWNWGLQRKREHYKLTGKILRYVDLNKELTTLKRQPGMEWLSEVDSQSLQEVLRDLDRAFTACFEKRARFPRFKGRKRDRGRFRIPQRVTLEEGKVYVPKVGWVEIRQSQPVLESTKSATFKQDAKGHWFVTLTVEFEMPEVALPPPDPAKVVGIDLGLINHKTTTEFVRNHQGICIEDLGVKALARTKLRGHAKSFHDAAMGEFRRQLEYKCDWNHVHLVPVDRFFPSSKRCSHCGHVHHGLTVADREWTCPVCGAHHKRDFNAAVNLRDEGLRILAAGQARESKRSGRDRKTRLVGQVSSS